MNLRGVANRVTSQVNPNTVAQWQAYAGLTVSDAGKTVPSYASPVALTIQSQSLTVQELAHIDSMNLGKIDRVVFVNGQIAAIDRENQKGGDLLVFEGATWLVTAVLEGWTTSGWCKAALTRQNGG